MGGGFLIGRNEVEPSLHIRHFTGHEQCHRLAIFAQRGIGFPAPRDHAGML